MAKKVRGDFRKIGIAILSAVILVCVVSLVLLNDSVKTAYAGEYLEYFYENFDVESPWDSAFSDWESGAKATIVDEGIDGKSLKINGVEDKWTEYMYADLPLSSKSVYTIQFKYKVLASQGDFTVFTRNKVSGEFLEAFHFTYAGGVEYTNLEKNAYQIQKVEGYYLAQVSFETDEADNVLGFGMEGAGIIVLDDVVVQKGGYLQGSSMQPGKEIFSWNFETLGFYGSKLKVPDGDQSVMFTNTNAINGVYSLRSVADMPYWGTIFETQDNIGFSAGKVYTLSFKFKIEQKLKSGEFFYVESSSASSVSYMRFLDGSIFEQASSFTESGKNSSFGRNNYILDSGNGYFTAKFTFTAVDSNTVLKISKGDIGGNTPAPDGGVIVVDDIKINEGIVPAENSNALRELGFEVFAESNYNSYFNAVQAFDESVDSRWVPAPRPSWEGNADGEPLTFIGVSYSAPVRLNRLCINEAVYSESGYYLGSQITKAILQAEIDGVYVDLFVFEGENCIGEDRVIFFPQTVAQRFRLAIYSANGDPTISDMDLEYSPNIALGKETEYTSNYNQSLTGELAVDGDKNSYWATKAAGEQSLVVDLKKAYNISAVVIREALFDGVPALSAFRLEYADEDEVYHVLYEGDAIGSYKLISFEEITARKIRLVLLNTTATTYNIAELEVYSAHSEELFWQIGPVAEIVNVKNSQITLSFPKAGEEAQYLVRINGEVYTYIGDDELQAVEKTFLTDDLYGNIALGKPTTSSPNHGPDYDGSKLVDGDFNTRWAGNGYGTHTVEIDLERFYSIDKMAIYESIVAADGFYMGERVMAYRIEYFNGYNWKVAYVGGKIGKCSVVTFDEIIASKIRFVILQAMDQPTIAEIAVYANDLSGDLSINKTGTDSGNYGADYTPDKMFDDDFSTRWASTTADNAYFTLELGSPKHVDTLTMSECVEWGQNINQFKIYYLENGEYKEVTSDGNEITFGKVGVFGRFDFDSVYTESLKVVFTDVNDAPTIYECSAFGHTPTSVSTGVKVNANYTDYGLEATNLTDNNYNTRWATAHLPTASDPIIFTFEYDSAIKVKSVYVNEYLGDGSWVVDAGIKDIAVEYFDGETYREAVRMQSQTPLFLSGTVISLPERVQSDKFRVVIYDATKAPSIWEIEFFEQGMNKLQPNKVEAGAVYGGYEVEKAFDQNYATRWASSVHGGDTLSISFAKEQLISSVLLQEALGEFESGVFWGGYTTAFRIEAEVDGGKVLVYEGNNIGFSRFAHFDPIKTSQLFITFGSAENQAVTLANVAVFSREESEISSVSYQYVLKLNEQKNIATEAQATASSTWSGDYSASKINDGNDSTRWSASASPFDGQWVMLDFGEERVINAMTLCEEYKYRVKSFTISYGDGEQWTQLYEGEQMGDDFYLEFTPIRTRFLRLDIVKADNVVTISEWCVYNMIDEFSALDVEIVATAGGTELVQNVSLDKAQFEQALIVGEKVIGKSDKVEEYFYSLAGKDQYGRIYAANTAQWHVDGDDTSGISIDQYGKLILLPEVATGEYTLIAEFGDKFVEQKIVVNKKEATEVVIRGSSQIQIPLDGSNVYEYVAVLYDQNGKEMTDDVTIRLKENYPGISFEKSEDSYLLTVSDSATDGHIVMIAEYGDLVTSNEILVSYYKYAVNSEYGYEIYNGSGVYNRPLYGSHINDIANGGYGYLGFAGDLPMAALAWTDGFNSLSKRGHIFIGVENGKWVHEMEEIQATYKPSYMEYVIRDSSFSGTLKITFTMGQKFDGLIAYLEVPESLRGRIVIATGGITSSEEKKMYDYDNLAAFAFKKQEAEGTAITIGENGFILSKQGYEIFAYCSAVMGTTISDASAMKSPAQMMKTEGGQYAMSYSVVSDTSEAFAFALTYSDPANLTGVNDLMNYPTDEIEYIKEYFEDLKSMFWVSTPDKYFDASVGSMVVANDRLYDEPSYLHGIVSWNYPYAGWRSMYGSVVIGWNDRVENSAAQFFDKQILDREMEAVVRDIVAGVMDKQRALAFGAVYDDVYGGNKFYDMTQSLVDQMFYNYEWTNNISYFSNNNYQAYNFIKYHLEWEEEVLGREDNLFESFLNMWNTDSIWTSGGGGITQTAYNLRAYKMMAELAEKFGKTEDKEYFESRAKEIEESMFEHLYSEELGIFGLFKDLDDYGYGRVHYSPDMAALSVPIDLDLVDDFQAYLLLSYGVNTFDDLEIELPQGAKLKFSSNWEPVKVWSLNDIYPDETIYFINQLYKYGYSDIADAYLKGFYMMFNNSDAPGAIWERQEHFDASGVGSTDFADTISPYIKMVADGMFGVDMQANIGKVTIKPSFNRSWPSASFNAKLISYNYAYDEKSLTETIEIVTQNSIDYEVLLNMRTSKISSVKVDGIACDYTVKVGIDFCYVQVNLPDRTSATVEVVYESAPLVLSEYPEVVGNKSSFKVSVNGIIKEIYDPQKVLADTSEMTLGGNEIVLKMDSAIGRKTIFLLVTLNDSEVWVPINVTVCENIRVENAQLVNDVLVLDLVNSDSIAHCVSGQVQFAGGYADIYVEIQAYTTEQISFALNAEQVTNLTQGSNLVRIYTDDGEVFETTFDVLTVSTDHGVMDGLKYVDLTQVANQNLADLHNTTYSPRPTTEMISWSVLPNGRSYWEAHQNNGVSPVPELSLLEQYKTNGYYKVGDVMFKAVNGENDSVFTSLYDQLPDGVTIDINDKASKFYFLLVASTNQMQCNIENARITVTMSNGYKKTLSLVNPDNLGDWMWNNSPNTEYLPYEKDGEVLMLGANTHAIMLELDLGSEKDIQSVTLETLSNEVLCGLLGISYVNNQLADIAINEYEGETLPQGSYDTSYSQSVATSSGISAVYNIVDGVLPDGLSLTAEGLLVGVPKECGTFEFTVLCTAENGSAEADFTIVIAPKSLQGYQVVVSGSYVYSGQEIIPEVSVEGLSKDDYDILLENNINAGNATVKIFGKGNYAGVVQTEFEILKATVVVSIPIPEKSVVTTEEGLPALKGNTTGGTYQWVQGQQLKEGSWEYEWCFVPDDTLNYIYENASGKLAIEVEPYSGPDDGNIYKVIAYAAVGVTVAAALLTCTICVIRKRKKK